MDEGTWRRRRTTSHMCSEQSSIIVTTVIGYKVHGEPGQLIATPALSTSLVWRLRQTSQPAFRIGEPGLVHRFVSQRIVYNVSGTTHLIPSPA